MKSSTLSVFYCRQVASFCRPVERFLVIPSSANESTVPLILVKGTDQDTEAESLSYRTILTKLIKLTNS
jgi:hypothetical protein